MTNTSTLAPLHDPSRHSTASCATCLEAIKDVDADLSPYTASDLIAVRVRLASNPATPLRELLTLAGDPSPAVRAAVEANPAVKKQHDILHALTAHEIPNTEGTP